MSKNTDAEGPQYIYPEARKSVVENPQITTMLGSAGLTAIDRQLFDNLYQQNHAIFVHGSIIANRIKPTSDIDFTIVGAHEDMPADIRDTLIPGFLAAKSLRAIDYVSTSIQSQKGRKISMHISEPDFRETYPRIDKPYATEYRPAKHAKSGDRKYFLPGITREGDIRLINFLCISDAIGHDGSTVTDVPQTGHVVVKGDSIFTGDDNQPHPSIRADGIIRIKSTGELDEVPADSAEEVAILGLEFDKMMSDTSMYNDAYAEQWYVKDPAARSMAVVGEFAQTDPSVVTNRLFDELAKHWSKVKPHKQR